MKTAKEKDLPKLSASVRVFDGKSRGSLELLGFAELTVAGAFVIRDIRVVNGKDDRPLVVFPRRGFGEGATRFYPVVSALTEEAREAARQAVCRAYRRAKSRSATS